MFKMNCEIISTTGEEFIQMADEIKKLLNAFNGLAQEIEEIYKGGDSYNFRVSFNGHNKDLTHVIAFLKNHGELMKKSAEEHDKLDKDFANAMSA